jgi:hypothetical protein
MRRISVTSPERGVIGEISLAGSLAELLGDETERTWGRQLRILWRAEEEIELIGLEDLDPRQVLTDLQNGLLYAEVAGMRLTDTPERPSVPGLAAFAGRVDLKGGRGRSAILSLWDRERESREVAEFASAQRYTAFTLTRIPGRARHRTLLSVLVPERYADQTLEEMTAFQLARARPVLLAEPVPTRTARTRTRPVAPRKALEGPVISLGEAGPAADWGYEGDEGASATRFEIDRIALGACRAIGSEQVRGPDRIWGTIASALYDCWRLSSGLKAVPTPIANHLKELARAVEVATREDRPRLELLSTRLLIRACGSEAWALGPAPRGRARVPPARFREECCELMRPVPAAARDALINIVRGDADGPLPYELVEPLIVRGYLDRHRMPTATGLAAVEAELARRRTPLPSVRSLLERADAAPHEEGGPDPETSEEGPRPVRVRRPRDAPATPAVERTDREIAPLLHRVEGFRVDPPGPDGEDTFRDALLPLLQAFWRVGRYGPAATDRAGRITAPSGPFLAERARVISEVTRERRARGEAVTTRALIRASGLEAWRVGMIAASGAPLQLPPRFREECSAQMREIPEGVRWALIALHEGEEHRYRKGVIGHLTRAGMLEAGAPPRLTEAGRRAALAELSTPWADLPSILSLVGEDPPPQMGPRWPAPDEAPHAHRGPDQAPSPPADPLEGDRFIPDETVRDRILSAAADDCDQFRHVAGAEARLSALMAGTLLLCWRMGHDPEGTDERRPPARVGDLIRERVRVIEAVTRSGRRSRDVTLVRDLLAGSGVEMWRYGALMRERRRSPLPARYREECVEPMRPVPPEARDRLVSLLERRSGRPMSERLVRSLVKEGLLEGDGLTLTETGRRAALLERAHRGGGAPSILSLAGQN